ncbi:arsenic resistance protein [Litorihabitans aurantiacus]|uniref:Arsenic resistance protein n=1 Tax=Litorihabitans aurantiacus TaxID=1930061 RepID=A0AA37UUK3_9MICO|nr:arsenic resistance protein [Litorihabitans aurantiacus]GMA30792.1 arsenic resistance protein [Litorihabitans aurantiacus]
MDQAAPVTPPLVAWWDRRQVPLYLAAIGAGALVGLAWPGVAPLLEHAVEPVLGLLLLATFLGVPMAEVGRGLRDARFLGVVVAANFVAVPLLAWGLSRFVADDRALLLGVLLVLLTPCVDYVIVFTGLAGGARARLLAAAPLLMLLQLALLPLFLRVFAGGDVVALIEVGPFVRAFIVLIALPLGAAALIQALARRRGAAGRVGRRIENGAATGMVPLMMATLAVVVGSQIAAVGDELAALVRVVPLYVAFVVVAVALGIAVGRLARLDVPATRAVAFSTATRNSLVVLPLALALPAPLALAPLAVVTQTLVELVAMVVLVRLLPRLVPHRA